MNDTVLIVDDEESVRRTFHEWLAGSGMNLRILAAADAEQALAAANREPIDLAVLDWNLGTGSDGLRLLEDLVEFHPDLVAILVTGYAAQATPLDALRKGVRDYLDKNQSLTREVLVGTVRRQLERIRPAKRQRAVTANLAAFREAVQKVLPLVRASAELNDPLPLPNAMRLLVQFAMDITGAADGVVIVRQDDRVRIWDAAGKAIERPATPFHRTLAASVLSRGSPSFIPDLNAIGPETAELHPFEQSRSSVLAVPIDVSPGLQVVMELFDKPEVTEGDRERMAATARIGAELLRQALAERHTHRLLSDAVQAALDASHKVSDAIAGTLPPSEPPPQAVMDALRRGLEADRDALLDAEVGLELVAAVRELAVRHGPDAVRHCVVLIRGIRDLLDGYSGS